MASHIRLLARLTVLLALVGALTAISSAQAGVVQQVRIPVGDTWFCDESFLGGVCETVIEAGDTVAWDFSGAGLPHTTTECGDSCDDPSDSPAWDSGTITDGSTFQFTFSEPGTYLYRCNVHPSQMRGQVVVQAVAPATEVPPAPVTPVEKPPPGPTKPDVEPGDDRPPAPPTPGGLPEPDGRLPEPAPADGEEPELIIAPQALAATGLERQQSPSETRWALAMLALVGTALVAAGAGAYRWTRQRR